MNNIYYDYIGAKGNYEIVDYIDTEIKITSNILDTKINTTSNILNTKIDFTSNFLRGYTDTNIINLDNKYNNLIREIPDNSLTNLYINNSNIGGEIRFFVKQSGIFDINNATGQPYRVKIGADGKLYLYYNYNAAIGLLETERWVEPINELIAHKVGIANLGAITGATDVTIAKIIIDVNQLNSIVLTDNIITNADRLILRDTSTLYGQAKIVFEKIKNQFTYANAIYAGIVGSVGFGIVSMSYGYIQSKVNADYIENNLKYQLSSNTVMTPAEKEQLKTDTFNVYTSNINDMNFYSCNLNILNGFINSNITTPQLIPKITTNEITYNGVEISTTLNNYVLKAGGTMSGRLNFNYGAGIFGTPVGGGGGSGERINLNTNGITATDYPPSLGVSGNSLWFSSPANHSYQWFNNGNQLMSLTSSGQLILNNPITTAERQYPPKAYTSSTNESVITFLGQSGMLSSTITLNPIGITYGSGVYEIYSSSRYNASEYQKRDLFNYATTTNEVGGHWASGQYNQFGIYQGVAYIKPDYLGDFLVVKLPNPIILTKFRFYPRINLNFRIPGEFKFYGSMNNIDYTEITQASQITPRLTNADIINGYYEKTLAAGFNTPYLYIGFAVNKLIGTSGFPDCVNFQEFQIYGKEALSSTASLAIGTSDASTYALNVNGVVNASSYIGIGSSLTTLDYNNITLNKPLVFPPDPTAVQTTILTSTPNVNKKSGFLIYVNNPVYPNGGSLYYSYDIYLPSYVSQAIVESSTDPYRNFHIRLSYASSYYEYLKNGLPNCLSYEIFMSDKANPGSSGIGKQSLNICALGTPENYYLDKVMPNDLFLMRSPFANFDRICVLSTRIADVRVIIEDLLN
jgi:hypothetical protein